MQRSRLTLRGWAVMAVLACTAAWLLTEMIAQG